MTNKIEFYNFTAPHLDLQLKAKIDNGAFVALLKGELCATEEDFLCEVAKIFQFPRYYGKNWNAFDECICDLEWIDLSQYTKIIFVIDGFNRMFSAGAYDSHEALIRHLNWMLEGWDEENISGEVWLNN